MLNGGSPVQAHSPDIIQGLEQFGFKALDAQLDIYKQKQLSKLPKAGQPVVGFQSANDATQGATSPNSSSFNFGSFINSPLGLAAIGGFLLVLILLFKRR